MPRSSVTAAKTPGSRATLGLAVGVLLVSLAVSALALADGAHDPPTSAPPPNGHEDLGWPRVVRLPDGREFALPSPPVAIVPAAAGCLDLLLPLVDPDRVAALPDQALLYSALAEPRGAWAQLPRFDRYEAEPLLALAPDLVLCHGWQSGATTDRLREAGVTVLVLEDPVSWVGAREQLLLMGRLLGEEARARETVAAFDDRVAALRDVGAGRTALALSFGSSGGWMAGARTTNDEQLRLAGLTNMAAAEGVEGHQQLTLEGLLQRDPDVLVVTAETRHWLLAQGSLAGLRAVRGGRVLSLPGWLYTAASQHLVDGAEALVAALVRADAGQPHVERTR